MLFLFALAIFASPTGVTACSVGELRGNPGYQYRVERVRQFLDSAEIIVRAKAVSEFADGGYWPRIRFDVLERLRAPDSLVHVELRGSVVDRDDFNRLPIPYLIVRSAGQRGDCEAREYKLGAEYLLILRPGHERQSPHWKPLAPFNEQVRGADDPWVAWVRQHVRPSGNPYGGAFEDAID